MSGVPFYLIPTARYKRAVKTGNKVTFGFEPPPPTPYYGAITDVYWATDVDGLVPVVGGTAAISYFVVIKTKDVQSSVTLFLNSDTLVSADMVTGTLNTSITVPLTVDGNGVGMGVYEIKAASTGVITPVVVYYTLVETGPVLQIQ